MQVLIGLVLLLVLWVVGFATYYAVSLVVLRIVGLVLPLAGRRGRK